MKGGWVLDTFEHDVKNFLFPLYWFMWQIIHVQWPTFAFGTMLKRDDVLQF